jgi:hypothetical protein
MNMSTVTEALEERLREMHHSARNNFQVVASLVSLVKRTLPPERQGEIRLLEEHMQSMAAVYRVAEPRRGMRVSVNRLVAEVVDTLRHIAGCPREATGVSVPESDTTIEQQTAVPLALFLALVLPPYLDSELASSGVTPVVVSSQPGGAVVLEVAAGRAPIPLEPIRARLVEANVRQLAATPIASQTGITLRLPPPR